MFHPINSVYLHLSALPIQKHILSSLIQAFYIQSFSINYILTYLHRKEQIIGGDQASAEVGEGVSSSRYADDQLLSA